MNMMTLLVAAASAQGAALPAFMTGCWGLVEGEHWTQECWMEPRGGLMLGASREGLGDKLKSWEHLRVQAGAGDKLVYLASPGGRTPVPFTATKVTSSEVEFTNAAHDYPQRIRYQLKGDKLEAEISLIDGSKPVRWLYVRENR